MYLPTYGVQKVAEQVNLLYVFEDAKGITNAFPVITN